MNFKKVVAAVLTAGMVMTAFTGCAKVDNKKALVSVEEKEVVNLGYAYFVARFEQANYDEMYVSYFGEGYWDQDLSGEGKTMQEKVVSDVVEELENNYVLAQHAKDYNVEITEADEKKITKAAKAFMKANSEGTIKEINATQEYVEKYLTDRTIATRVEAAIKAEANVEVTKEEAAQRTFTYALFSTMGSDGATEVTADEKKAQKALAKNLVETKDFDGAQELGATVTTYSYGEGDTGMDEKILSAADALKEGEVSSVIGVSGKGYYVLRLDKELDEEATSQKVESLTSERQDEVYQAVLEGFKKDITFDVDEKALEKIKFDTLFKVVYPESEDEENE